MPVTTESRRIYVSDSIHASETGHEDNSDLSDNNTPQGNLNLRK